MLRNVKKLFEDANICYGKLKSNFRKLKKCYEMLESYFSFRIHATDMWQKLLCKVEGRHSKSWKVTLGC